ncbi:kynureninase activity protein [[Candida] boidinii]|nr:kynureninase activity protein [[Candida] boidinii]
MSAENSFLQEAIEKDSNFKTWDDLFQIPTFNSMGLPIPPNNNNNNNSSKDNGDEKVNYLCGNSLGLMPKSTPIAISNELKAWGDRGVESHFRHPDEDKGLTSWVDIDLPIIPLLAPIVGAKENEVACMGTLTMNLNSLLCSFYKPDFKTGRYKILFEKGSFPSDYYAFLNQVKLHDLNPEDALIQIKPSENQYYINTNDILKIIDEQGDSISIICLPGIQYYTGQFFDLKSIVEKGHEKGCIVGFDLAHAVGNIDLKLHDWGVDFAAWCSYKYLNSGPGAIGGIFINEKFFNNNNNNNNHNNNNNNNKEKNNDIDQFRPRLAGWWGNNSQDRFKMLEIFNPIESALGFRQSNPSVIDVVSLKSSLEIFNKIEGNIKTLRIKSIELTNYLEKLLKSSKFYIDPLITINNKNKILNPCFTIITPSDSNQRGAQLSLLFLPDTNNNNNNSLNENIMEKIFNYLNQNGTICDERRPNVIRLAPCPLYNTFKDVYNCVELLNKAFEELF